MDSDELKAKAEAEREPGWHDYFRCFTYAEKWDVALLAAAAFGAIGSGVTMPLLNLVVGKMVANFTGFANAGASQSQSAISTLKSQVNESCLYIFMLFLARFLFNYISKFSLRITGLRLSAAIRTHYFSSLLVQSVHVLDTVPPGSAAGTITSAANTLQIAISEKLGTFTEYLVTIIAAFIVSFHASWSLTLVTASASIFGLLSSYLIMPFVIAGHTRLAAAETRATAAATETLAAIRIVYACGAQSRMRENHARFVRDAERHGLRMAPFFAANAGLGFFSLGCAYSLCFWYGSRRGYAQGARAVETVVVVLMNVILVFSSIERMWTPLVAASRAVVAAASFFAVIDAPKARRGHLRDVALDGDLVLKGVTFAYPGRPSAKILDDLNLTIEHGKITALVGPSGSGKSTIVGLLEKWYLLHDQAVIAKTVRKQKKIKPRRAEMPELVRGAGGDEKGGKWKSLLARLRQPKGRPPAQDNDHHDHHHDDDDDDNDTSPPPIKLRGTIIASGYNLDDIDEQWWRSQIGLVQQEPFLFNDTISANVMRGLANTPYEHEPLEFKQERVRAACREAYADEFIARLPAGYDTQVGDAGGLRLSGGQRQRLAIARSIIKQPKILILDEATSAVDAFSEGVIQAALERVSRGRTTIVIAHRLSTVRKAHRIVVLERGRLVEQGTHESLVADDSGVYAGLVRAQEVALGSGAAEEDGGADEIYNKDTGDDSQWEVRLARSKSAASDAGGPRTISAVETPWEDQGLFSSFGRLLWEQKSRFPNYALLLSSACLVAATKPLQAFLFAHSVDSFTIPRGPEAEDHFLSRVNFMSLMWFMLAIAMGTGNFTMGWVATTTQHLICAAYRQQYFSALTRQPIAFYDAEDHSVGTLAARVQGDPRQLEELLGVNLGMVLSSALQLVGVLLIAFAYSWRLALLGTGVMMPLLLGCALYRFRYERAFELISAGVFAESSKWAAEAVGAFRCVVSLTLEDEIDARYRALLCKNVGAVSRKARWSTLVFALSDSLGLACQALIFWYGAHLFADGDIDNVAFFICYIAILQGAASAGLGFSFMPNAAQATAAANRILSVRESFGEGENNSTQPGPDTNKDKDDDFLADGSCLELCDITFRYPTRDVTVFKHVNLRFERGQFTALVGASGSGKSSVIALLERFYAPQRGAVLANGSDIGALDVHTWRRQLGLVAQEPTLFQGTLRENLLLGSSVNAQDVTALHKACRDAAIHDFIVSLPCGYETDVGARGVALSGGQKQRVAIARAILQNPKVLLLDEATSSLDSDSERAITDTLKRVATQGGRTTVAVAHRLATIQHADVIYMLGQGKVLEMGTHEELLGRKGAYYHMCQSQALNR